MGTALETLRNIGPSTANALRNAGILDAETFLALGANEAARKLMGAGDRPHFIVYYVLHMTVQMRPWNDCKGAEKAALRARYDALVAAPSTDGMPRALEDELDRLGLRRPI